MKKRQFTPEFKTKIVLEVLKENKTLSEIASREGIAVPQLSGWKREFLDNAYRAFATTKIEKDAKAMVADAEDKEKELMAKVGCLTIENDWLKKKYEQAYGPDWQTILGYKR